MTINIQKVTVLGTGVLGSQIAYQTAYCGYEVTAYDVSADALETGQERIRGLAERYEREVKLAANGRAQDALGLIGYTPNLAEAVRDADLVIEAAPELIALKRGLYVKLARVAPEKTIFATNSSTLLPSDLADYTGRPERFLALHFANEIWIRNMAEIMGHSRTDPDVYEAVVEFARSIGMEPIEIKKEHPAYILNSLLGVWFNSSLDLVLDGIAEPEMVDKTWRIATGAPEGPFQVLDITGLRTLYNIQSSLPDESAQARATYVKERYIDKGKFGRDSSEGFYTYPAKTDDAALTA
jgi:3-hydroxyacyl-CoA dehydrogenase